MKTESQWNNYILKNTGIIKEDALNPIERNKQNNPIIKMSGFALKGKG